MRKLAEDAGRDDLVIESAGTSGYHTGEPPDARSAEVAKRRGYPLGGRSQQFKRRDFARFDLVVAMDRKNQRDLLAMASSDEERAKVVLLRDYDPESPEGAEVPDPWYGEGGFDQVLDICIAGCRGLLASLG